MRQVIKASQLHRTLSPRATAIRAHISVLTSPVACTRCQRSTASPVATAAMSDLHWSRALGVLLWEACGDALAAPVEGHTHEQIAKDYPGGLVKFVNSERGYGRYTDDTQMALALAVSLVEKKRLDPAHVSMTYAQHFDITRGYGQTAMKILEELRTGQGDWSTIATKYIPEGSFANGGAMRIAPLGIAYRNAPKQVLRAAVEGALCCTHVHPEAVDGAVVLAAAVGWLCLLPPPPEPGRACGAEAGTPTARELTRQLLEAVLGHAETEEMRSRLQRLLTMVDEIPGHVQPRCCDPGSVEEMSAAWAPYLASAAWQGEVERAMQLQSNWFQIRAVDAVAVTLCAFAHHGFGPQPALAVVAAAHYGGDTDTIAAMAAALCGAYHGRRVPLDWYNALEDDHVWGRAGLIRVAGELADLDIRE